MKGLLMLQWAEPHANQIFPLCGCNELIAIAFRSVLALGGGSLWWLKYRINTRLTWTIGPATVSVVQLNMCNQQDIYFANSSNMHRRWKLDKEKVKKLFNVSATLCVQELVSSKWVTAVNTAHCIPPCSDLLHLPLFSIYSPKITFQVAGNL